MGSSSERSSAPESQLISRRTLVRAGATAAWTVPLVQVVSAAPALAAVSTTKSNLTATLTANYATGPKVHVSGTVTTSGAAATGLQLTIQLPTGVTASDATVAPGNNWTKPSSFGGNTVTFISTGTGTSRSFDFDIAISTTPAGDVLAIPFATNQGTVQNGSYHLPVFSPSASLSLSNVTAAYVATDASQLNIKGTVTNGSGATTTALKLKVTIPSGKYSDKPVPTSPSGWDGAPPTATAASGGGWDVTFTSNGQLAANASKSVDAVIQLNDTDATKKYAGSSYQVDVVASPGNGTETAPTKPTVGAATNSTLAVTGMGGTGSPSFTSPDKKTYKTSLAVKNNGPKLISNIVVTVKLSGAAKTLDSLASGWTNITASAEKTTWRFQRDASVSILPGSATTVDPAPQFTFKDASAYTATFGASADNATTLTAP